MHNVAKVTEVVGTSETSIEGWAKFAARSATIRWIAIR